MLPKWASRRYWTAGIDRNQWWLVFAIFVSWIGFDFVQPFIPLFVQELGVADIGAAARWSALILGVSPVLSAFTAPMWGLWGDRRGHKLPLQISLVGLGVLLVIISAAQDIWQLFFARSAFGIFGGYTVLSLAMITAAVPRERLGQAISLQQGAQILALAVAPVVGGLIAASFGLRLSIFLAGVLCFVTTLIVGGKYREHAPDRAVAGKQALPALRLIVSMPGLAWSMLLVFLAFLVDRSFFLLLPLQASVLARPGESVAVATGIIFSSGAVAGALSATVLGRLSVRYRGDLLLVLSLVAGGLLTIAMAAAPSTAELTLARVGHSLFAGGAITLIYARASRSFPPAARGAAFGVLGSAGILGNGLSYPIAALPTGDSLWNGFLAIAMLYFASAALVLVAGALRRRSASAQLG